MNEFITPPGPHHTHAENHIFIVTEGEATVISDGKEIAVRQDEALLIDGSLPHSIWNRTDKTITVVKISTLPSDR